MTVQDIFRTVAERIQSTAGVKTVYGDPVTAEGKTIIPVAKVRYGFGGGGGWGREGAETENEREAQDGVEHEIEESRFQAGGGGGGGGGVDITPVGVIEITAGDTRYISFEDRQRLIRAGFLLLLIAMFLFRPRRRK